jgi:hypothetical protein
LSSTSSRQICMKNQWYNRPHFATCDDSRLVRPRWLCLHHLSAYPTWTLWSCEYLSVVLFGRSQIEILKQKPAILRTFTVIFNLLMETLSECTSDLAITRYFHVLSSSLFTARSATWPYVVGGTENIVKVLQLNKDCISHLAAFLCCNSLVGNLPSNSCIRGWSDPQSLTQVTAVVNGLGVYSAIGAWKSMV